MKIKHILFIVCYYDRRHNLKPITITHASLGQRVMFNISAPICIIPSLSHILPTRSPFAVHSHRAIAWPIRNGVLSMFKFYLENYGSYWGSRTTWSWLPLNCRYSALKPDQNLDRNLITFEQGPDFLSFWLFSFGVFISVLHYYIRREAIFCQGTEHVCRRSKKIWSCNIRGQWLRKMSSIML